MSVVRLAETRVPTVHGTFRMLGYRDEAQTEHLAVVHGSPAQGALVRVHSECLTGEAFGSLKCDCGPQLYAALQRIAFEDGVVIYLRGHEGRGIGLINKLRAYRLQEDGLDTVDSNLALGLPADSRDYSPAAAILADLGIGSVRLITNNPDKVEQLRRLGTVVLERVGLQVGVGDANLGYLQSKRDRMGHQLALPVR